jgi:hypothetical protein
MGGAEHMIQLHPFNPPIAVIIIITEKKCL